MDWDDTKSYGPETITYTWSSDCGDCIYYIYDYTNRGNSESMELSYSSAKVTIYTGNHLVGIYNVPVGIKGTRWNVFSIVDGRILPINSIE